MMKICKDAVWFFASLLLSDGGGGAGDICARDEVNQKTHIDQDSVQNNFLIANSLNQFIVYVMLP